MAMKRDRSEPPEPRPRRTPRELGIEATPRGKAKRCPLCHDDVPRGEGYRCTKCRARHHLGCLGESARRRCGSCGGAVVAERPRAGAKFGAEQVERKIHQRGFALATLLGLLSSCVWCVFWGQLHRLLFGIEGRQSLWVFLPVIAATLACAAAVGWATLHLVKRYHPR